MQLFTRATLTIEYLMNNELNSIMFCYYLVTKKKKFETFITRVCLLDSEIIFKYCESGYHQPVCHLPIIIEKFRIGNYSRTNKPVIILYTILLS